MKWVVSQGSLYDGFEIYGPFDSNEQAWRFGDQELDDLDGDWTLLPVTEPEPGWDWVSDA